MAEAVQRATRYDLLFPMRCRIAGTRQWLMGKTSNISTSGVLFRLNDANELLTPGAELELTVTLATAPRSAKAQVVCRGTVVRYQVREKSTAAVAVRIARYRMATRDETLGGPWDS